MTDADLTRFVRLVAKEIADDLFHNIQGHEADRLVLEMPGRRDGGGWSKSMLRDRVAKILQKQLTQWQEQTLFDSKDEP
jgi:hypothetical protein